MKITVLDKLLVSDRQHQRLAKSGGSYMTVPAISEVKLDPKAEPLLVTNARGTFVPTRLSREGMGRYGYSEIPLEEEDALLNELHRSLMQLSEQRGWANRCRTVGGALTRMKEFGLIPKYAVIPSEDLSPEDREAADKLTLTQGHVAETGEVQILVGALPKGCALVTTAPPLVGTYTRVGNHVGIMIQHANQSMVVVSNDVV